MQSKLISCSFLAVMVCTVLFKVRDRMKISCVKTLFLFKSNNNNIFTQFSISLFPQHRQAILEQLHYTKVQTLFNKALLPFHPKINLTKALEVKNSFDTQSNKMFNCNIARRLFVLIMYLFFSIAIWLLLQTNQFRIKDPDLHASLNHCNILAKFLPIQD